VPVPDNPLASVGDTNPARGLLELGLTQEGAKALPSYALGFRWAINPRWTLAGAWQGPVKGTLDLKARIDDSHSALVGVSGFGSADSIAIAAVRKALALPQLDDWIGHKLTGSVIGYLTAALVVRDRGATRLEKVLADQNVAGIRVATERVDVRMLDQKQRILALTGDPRGMKPPLQLKGRLVVEAAQLLDSQVAGSGNARRDFGSHFSHVRLIVAQNGASASRPTAFRVRSRLHT